MFKSNLTLVALPQNDLWYTGAALSYASAAGDIITMPAGVITDLASIPRMLRNLPAFDPNGASRRPAAMHDWCYMGERSRGKSFADNLLREMLLAEGMSHLDAGLYYDAVHLFGDHAWASDGRRHPFDANPGNLELSDFIDEESFNAWLATCPTPNECMESL